MSVEHARVDGNRTLAEILHFAAQDDRGLRFFERLWQYDQIVFDASRAAAKQAETYVNLLRNTFAIHRWSTRLDSFFVDAGFA